MKSLFKVLLAMMILVSCLAFSNSAKAQAGKTPYPSSGIFSTADSLQTWIQWVFKPKSYNLVTDGQAIQRSMNGIAQYIVKMDSASKPTSNFTQTVTKDFASTAANTSLDSTITMTGATIGDRVSITSTIYPANSDWRAFVSSANTISIRFVNFSTSAINPASATFIIKDFGH